MPDSTPTAVTVSDRMRGLIEQLVHASGAAAVHPENPEIEKALDIIWNRVKFEVGWKETVIDQRGKRIQELEGMLVEDARKALAESPTAEREIWCPNDEPCSPDCEHCAQLLSQTAPADETRVKCMNCLDTGYMRNQDMPGHTIPCTQDCAAAAPPQTRGEAMPEIVAQVIDSLQKRIASDDSEIWGTLETAANWLAKDRSRLLTALEEKEKQGTAEPPIHPSDRRGPRGRHIDRLVHWSRAFGKWCDTSEEENDRLLKLEANARHLLEQYVDGIGFNLLDANEQIAALHEKLAALQSAAVLQQEELERLSREGGHPRPSIDGGQANYPPTSRA